MDDKMRAGSSRYLQVLETVLYAAVGLLLAAAAVAALLEAGTRLWNGIVSRTITDYGLQVLDQLLIVLVLVEILHTVRISIRSKEILIEPFLIVGLIASIRRVLVITMQAAKLVEGHQETADPAATFRNSMIELGLVGLLVLVFVGSIYVLRSASSRTAYLLQE